MLIDLYFPELKAQFGEVMAVRDKLNQLIGGYKAQYKTGDLDGSRWLELFQPLFESLGQKATQFEQRVAVFRVNV